MELKDDQKQEHLRLLAKAYFQNLDFLDPYDTGSPMLDCKRPFGNSSVSSDVLEIIEMLPEEEEDGDMVYSDQQRTYALNLYTQDLTPYLIKKCAPLFEYRPR